MADHDADPADHAESNTSGSRPAYDLGKWGSEDRLQNLANLLAVIVALAAIGLAVWQGYEQRRFYRLSMMPHLDPLEASLDFSSPLDSEYFPLISSLGADSAWAVSYSLRNSGLGPAAIKRVIAFQDGEMIIDSERPDSLNASFQSELRRDLAELPFPASPLFGGAPASFLLQAGKVHPFIEVATPFSGVENTDSLDRSPIGYLDEVMEKRSFVFCYCSVYGTDCDQAVLGGEPPVENACGY